MVAGQDSGRPAARIAAAEAALLAVEAGLCGIPLALWLGQLPAATAQPLLRAGLPLIVAVALALALRVLGSLRPVFALLGARRRQQPVTAADAEAAQRTLASAPRESAAMRLLLWGAGGGAVALAGFAHDQRRLGLGFASVLVLHGAAVAAVRAFALDDGLDRLRPLILANVEGIRMFAAGYRRRVVRLAGGTLGLAHAALALLVWSFVPAAPRGLALVALLLWPTLLIATPLWLRSLRRRTRAVEEYFDATVRSAGTRGPSRDEPRALPAFLAAQSLSYRLSAYLAFSLALAGVAAVAIARQLGAIDVAAAARLLGALAIVVAGTLAYAVLTMRRMLAPLMRHLGSRHFLPVARIRSRVGLRPKLLACFGIVVAVACGTLALFALSPAGTAGAARAGFALGAMLGAALGLTVLAVSEVVEPIQALEDRSEEMARGELARPVPPSGEADEIGRLMVAFEEMRRSLRDRLRSTESINIDLEREVRRRTEALEQRNADLRDALDKLRRAQDDLIRSEKLASMGRLVAGIAHEINNPVNAVINSLGPLEEIVRQIEREPAHAAELARSAEEMLTVVQRGAARTKAIVQALHNYSRGDEAVPREVSLARSVEDSLDLLRHRLRNVTVVKEVDPGARILGLPGQIDQVLMNLLTNAAQALGDGGGSIRISVVTAGNEVRVKVADDGPGIPTDILPRIFDPFFTTKDVGEGSGLGLSIVHGIVERHGGHIAVDSAPGRGTTFTLTFPKGGSGARPAAGSAGAPAAKI
jgi:signal transduction histidine kinase